MADTQTAPVAKKEEPKVKKSEVLSQEILKFLGEGEKTHAQIADHIKMSRPRTFKLLKVMAEKNQIRKEKKEKRFTYIKA